MERTCKNCRWYYDWFGVCFNGDSEWCADCPHFAYEKACELWEEVEDEASK